MNLKSRSTTIYKDGDMAYVIMGFLRIRPMINSSDSEFQAFARLSMANDSDLFLERMLCLLPKSAEEPWWSLSDAWDVRIWDVDPKIQICGIGEDNTMIVDGARGAWIRWHSFAPVLTLGKERLLRRLVRWILRSFPALFLVGLIWIIIVETIPGHEFVPTFVLGIGPAFLCVSSMVVLSAPVLIRQIYRAKVHASQPWFFGIEGYVDLYELELLIFGSNEGKLQWSTISSRLCSHDVDRGSTETDSLRVDIEKQNWICGKDPVKARNDIKELVKKANKSSISGLKIFTLVDTYTMTVTLFQAVRPPVAVVLAGAEGGMQRALLCSYNLSTGALCRETVLRMETRVRDKMDALCRLRIGLSRGVSKSPLSEPTDFTVSKGPWWRRVAYAVAIRCGL